MPGVWTEDPWLGNALAPIANAIGTGPLKGLQAANIQQEIELRKLQRKKLEDQLAASAADVANYNRTVDATAMPEVPRLAPIPFEGPMQSGEDRPADFTPATPEGQHLLDTEKLRRDQAKSRYALGAAHATSFGDVATGAPKLGAQNEVLIGGVPTDPAKIAQLNVALEGKIDTDQAGIFKSEGTRRNYLSQQSIKYRNTKAMTDDEVDTAAQALNYENPKAVEKVVDHLGRSVPYYFRKAEFDPVHAPMIDEINRRLAQRQGATAAPPTAATGSDPTLSNQATSAIQRILSPSTGGGSTPAVPGSPFPAPQQPVPAMPATPPTLAPTTAAPPPPMTAAPGAAAAAPGAAGPSPIVPALSTVPTVNAPIGAGDPAKFRDELLHSPLYQQYAKASGAWSRIVELFKQDSADADLAAIYALAQLYDPGSVVREGEQRIISSNGAVNDTLTGIFRQMVGQGGRFQPQQKANILLAANEVANSHYDVYATLQRNLIDSAKRNGINPAEIPVLPPPVGWKMRDISSTRRLQSEDLPVIQQRTPTEPGVNLKRLDQMLGIGG